MALSCRAKSGDGETDARCCANDNPPSWCPSGKPNDREIKSQISRASNSRQAMSFAMKESGEDEGNKAMMGAASPQSFRGSGGGFHNPSHFPGPGFGNFWPMFCPWWKWHCRFCYYWHIKFSPWPNWWGYLMCIWNHSNNYGGPY